MSSEARPISTADFAEAIEDLPVENLYFKALEISNSVKHLEESNRLLQDYSDSIKDDETIAADVRAAGDKDCLDAIKENLIVIERQNERIRLLKAEVERRGQRWHEAEPKEKEKTTNGASSQDEPTPQDSMSQPPGRLTDEELRQQLEARLVPNGEDEEGMYL